MFGRGSSSVHNTLCRRVPAVLATAILIPVMAAAQESQFTPNRNGPSFLSIRGDAPVDVRRITLADAQQLAQTATDPLARLGQLQVEAARQHRLGVTSMYFPSVTTQAFNLHLSETPGELLSFRRPLTGALISVPVGVIAQDQTTVNVVATQPITQLFAVRQLVKIAQADENIARTKAGMPLTTITRQVEKNFFDLLVAERELAAAASDARKVRTSWATVGDAGLLATAAQQTDALRVERAQAAVAGEVATLTAALNGLLGLAPETRLELVPPAPLVENLTLKDALARAQASPSFEVVEAEQTAVKARSAAKLARLAYVPGVAILGGYVHQDALSDTVLPENFAYVGVVATYTLFDSFKRERAIKEASAQEQAANLGVELTKAKSAATVKSAYIELERSRDAYHFARQMLSAGRTGVRLVSNSENAEAGRARAEADVFRAEKSYREAYAALTSLIGDGQPPVR
jgi:outer membrane protein TolC